VVSINDAAAASPATTATENAAGTTAGNNQATDAQPTISSGSGGYEKLRTQCPVMMIHTTEVGYYAC
jgi:hypothetical protein